MENILTQTHVDTRLVINEQIGDLFGSAFEDYGKDGIIYVMNEVERLGRSFLLESETGKIV
jgi:hypothetical protein